MRDRCCVWVLVWSRQTHIINIILGAVCWDGLLLWRILHSVSPSEDYSIASNYIQSMYSNNSPAGLFGLTIVSRSARKRLIFMCARRKSLLCARGYTLTHVHWVVHNMLGSHLHSACFCAKTKDRDQYEYLGRRVNVSKLLKRRIARVWPPGRCLYI